MYITLGLLAAQFETATSFFILSSTFSSFLIIFRVAGRHSLFDITSTTLTTTAKMKFSLLSVVAILSVTASALSPNAPVPGSK